MPSITPKAAKSPEKQLTTQTSNSNVSETSKKTNSFSSQFKNLFVKSPKLQPISDSTDSLISEQVSNTQSGNSVEENGIIKSRVVPATSSMNSIPKIAEDKLSLSPMARDNSNSRSNSNNESFYNNIGLVPIHSTELLNSMSRSNSRKQTSRGASRDPSSRKPLSREGSTTRRTSSGPNSRRSSADSNLRTSSKFVKAMPNVAFTEGSLRVFEDNSHDHVLKPIKVLEKAPSSSGILSGFLRKSTNASHNDVAFSLLPEQNRMDFQRRLSIQSRRTFDEADEDNLDEDDEEDEDEDDYDESDSSDDEMDPLQVKEIKFHKVAAVGYSQLNLINKLVDKINVGEDASTNKSYKLTDKYGKLLGIIGKGSYGIVKLVSKTDQLTKHEHFYAVKELKLKDGEDINHFSTRLTSEFVISNSLNHLNVVKTLDLMQNPAGIYSEIMEYCPGGDLYSLISKTHGDGLHHIEADCFLKQIMNGVTYMHSKGVAHCDLKPENILLTTSGVAKISDFGTSAVFRTAWEKEVHFSSGACGSEPYVAPEEFIVEQYDPRLVDIWAVGVLYMVMVSGTYVWVIAKETDELYVKYLSSRPKPGKAGTFEPIETMKFSGDEYCFSRKATLYGMLDPNPDTRLTGEHVLNSTWLKNYKLCEASYSSHHHW